MSLGEEIDLSYKISLPTHGVKSFYSPVTAGSYVSITAIGGSVSVNKINDLQTQIAKTKAILDTQNSNQLKTITREDLMGDMFYAGSLSYFSEYTALSHVSGLQNGLFQELLPSIGTYGYVPKVNYFFGFPQSIQAGSIEMDLDSVSTFTGAGDNNNVRLNNFVLQSGALSSVLEHVVPEQMFVSTTNPGEAVSAMKALGVASSQGQRIFQITQQNQLTALPNINHDSSIISEIRTALASGKEVITHTDSISVLGWNGAGYIILDPETGSGAYKISGGINGGSLDTVNDTVTKTGNVVSVMQGFADLFNWADDALALDNIGKGLSIISALATAISIGSKCSSDAASVLILFSTVLTLISLAPGLLVGIGVLLVFQAIFISLVLSIMFAFAISYIVGGVCKK